MNIQDNKELVRRSIEEIWNGHKLEMVSEFVGADLLEESLEHVQQFLGAFPDAHITIEDMVVVGKNGSRNLYSSKKDFTFLL